MTEVIPETLKNSEEQENVTETDNVSVTSMHSPPSLEEQHNQEDSVPSLLHSPNEQHATEETSIHEPTISIAEIYNNLPTLDTIPEQERTGEDQQEEEEEVEEIEEEEVEEIEEEVEEVEVEVEVEVEEEEEEEEEVGVEGRNHETTVEEREVELPPEVVEDRTQEQLQYHQEQEQAELQYVHQQQNDIASTNTSCSDATENSIYSQQQEEVEEEEEEEEEIEEESRNVLPEITVPSSPIVNNNNRVRSASTATPSTVNGLLPRSQRVWEMDRQAPECRRCHRRFNFLVRRHHCRRCGQIVCDKCSSHRIRLPVEELIEDPMVSTAQYPLLASQTQRVCDSCYREPIRRSSESHSRRSYRAYPMNVEHSMRRTNSSQSLMIDCPVCGHSFLGMPKQEQEEHLQRCLNVGSPPVQSPRYIVYQLSADSTQIGDECPICFDEFNPGDKVSRMICLCSYHQHCLSSWLQRGKGCPVHYDYLQV